MQNADKKPDNPYAGKIAVYSFAGSLMIPTEQGAFFANAVGGEIASRPVGNTYLLFDMKYIWNVAGEVSAFDEPIRIRLNTAMAVTETFDFKFPPPEVQDEDLAEADSLAKAVILAGNALARDDDDEVGDEIEGDEVEDEDESFDEDDIDEDDIDEEEDVAEDEDVTEEVEDELSKVLNSHNEISW